MSNPVLTVKQATNGTTGELLGRRATFWCPGCDDMHRIVLTNEDGSTPRGEVWGWDDNLDAPTFTPSILCRIDFTSERPPHICHSFIRAGRWEFLGDSTHALAGQTADMVPLPDWLVKETP